MGTDVQLTIPQSLQDRVSFRTLRHLKPLGKPAQNARKWFASVELERLSRDPVWLDKAVRIVERYVQDVNRKRRSKSELPADADSADAAVEVTPGQARRRGQFVAVDPQRN